MIRRFANRAGRGFDVRDPAGRIVYRVYTWLNRGFRGAEPAGLLDRLLPIIQVILEITAVVAALLTGS